MADPVLHIKDSFYFEVPKVLCPSSFTKRSEFPEVWVKLDPDFQNWEFERQYEQLKGLKVHLPAESEVHHEWEHWVHADHANFAKPFDEFLEGKYQAHLAAFKTWKQAKVAAAQSAEKKDNAAIEQAQGLTLDKYLKSPDVIEQPYAEFSALRNTREFQAQWAKARQEAGDVAKYQADAKVVEWSDAKIAAYNVRLSGKVLIPQPFGELRNLYEAESGFCISKYLVIQIFVGLVLVLLFGWLANRLRHSHAPKGKLWNLLEVFLVFIRDQIAKPSLGGHHEDHGSEHAAAPAQHGDSHGHGPDHGHGQAPAAHAHAAPHADPVKQFTPLLWTIFFFVLGCNLMGMVPWAGASTAAFAVTFALAAVTFFTGMLFGMKQFGVLGFFLNQVPGMDLPWYMAIFLKPMILAIELLGLCIKHLVLAIRLLANMVAGHLVLLGVMGLAFGADAAMHFTNSETPGWQWYVTATIAVLGSTAFSCLELFVAFLQAYIFTFLSALFIGASIHKH